MLKNKTIKDFLRVILSNGMGLVIGIAIAILLPIKLPLQDYGYWQLYYFYSGYVGLFMFGFSDGINLKYAGEEYSSLNKKLFRTYFRIVVLISVLMAAILFVFSTLVTKDSDRTFALFFVSLNIILFNVNGFFIHVNQVSSRFNYYSWSMILNRLIFVLSIIPMFFMPFSNYRIYIIINVISRVLVVVYSVYTSRDIVFGKANHIKSSMPDLIDNIKAGLPLTLSSILTMFLLSYTRIIVDRFMDIKEFGLYSFANSIISIVVQIVLAISAVLYPLLRRIDKSKYESLNNLFSSSVIILGSILLCTYFPAYYIIKIYIPKFSPILNYLFCLYPLMIYQAKSNIVVTTFYKTLRFEKRLLVNNFIGLTVSIFVTLGAYKIFGTMISIVASWVLCYIIWIYYSEHFIKKKCNWTNPNQFVDLFIIIGFILSTQIDNLIIGFIIYLLYLLVISTIYRRSLLQWAKQMTALLKV